MLDDDTAVFDTRDLRADQLMFGIPTEAPRFVSAGFLLDAVAPGVVAVAVLLIDHEAIRLAFAPVARISRDFFACQQRIEVWVVDVFGNVGLPFGLGPVALDSFPSRVLLALRCDQVAGGIEGEGFPRMRRIGAQQASGSVVALKRAPEARVMDDQQLAGGIVFVLSFKACATRLDGRRSAGNANARAAAQQSSQRIAFVVAAQRALTAHRFAMRRVPFEREDGLVIEADPVDMAAAVAMQVKTAVRAFTPDQIGLFKLAGVVAEDRAGAASNYRKSWIEPRCAARAYLSGPRPFQEVQPSSTWDTVIAVTVVDDVAEEVFKVLKMVNRAGRIGPYSGFDGVATPDQIRLVHAVGAIAEHGAIAGRYRFRRQVAPVFPPKSDQFQQLRVGLELFDLAQTHPRLRQERIFPGRSKRKPSPQHRAQWAVNAGLKSPNPVVVSF